LKDANWSIPEHFHLPEPHYPGGHEARENSQQLNQRERLHVITSSSLHNLFAENPIITAAIRIQVPNQGGRHEQGAADASCISSSIQS
jgi:hypothetical protein